MQRKYPACLRVMAEYGSSGIWVVEPRGPFRHGMIEHQTLGLPADLAAAFDRWIEAYFMVLDDHESFDVAGFNAEGRRLASLLKQVVGPDTRVLHASEAADGSLAQEEEVTL